MSMSHCEGTILIVDDQPVNLALLKKLLEKSDYNVLSAKDGNEALLLCQSSLPDLMLLDIEMPGLNGLEVLDHLKTHPATEHLPVILVTCKDQPGDETAGLERGAIDYINKPFNLRSVLAKVNTHIAGIKRQQFAEALIGKQSLLFEHSENKIVEHIEQRKRDESYIRLVARSMETISDGVWIADEQFAIVMANNAFTRITGQPESAALGTRFLPLIEHQGALLFDEITETVCREGVWGSILTATRNTTEAYSLKLTVTAVHDEQGLQTHYVGVFNDITYRLKAEESLRTLAHYDSLTGLANRTLFSERVNQAILSCSVSNELFALLFIDLDHFKKINDSLGHEAGDIVLKQVAARLDTCRRSTDTFARLAGDEYASLIRTGDDRQIAKIAKRIVASLSQPYHIGDHEAVVTPSVGIAVYPADGNTYSELLKHADMAMYDVKRSGKNNYRFFSSEMNSHAQEHLALETDLRNAMKNNALDLHYQPKVNAKTGEVEGVEALCRWIHPTKGNISPEIFIAIAEESYLILELGEWVLKEACSHFKQWHADTLVQGRIAVNLSTRQFMQPNLVERVDAVLQETGLSPTLLELEITEGTIMHDMDQALMVMEQFRSRGISLAIDDFGTGYSSLNYLKKFPLDTLKIDRSFIIDISTNEQDRKIVSSIVDIAHSLGLTVVAEGVETADQADVVRSMQAEEFQGFLFSKALSAEDLESLLKREDHGNDMVACKQFR